MPPIRPSIRDLTPNGIGQVAALGLGEPDLIPLWFGESDLVTPKFICDAAARALEEGRTFYVPAHGMMELRAAIGDFHARTTGVKVAPERITVPGSAMLAVVTALQCMVEKGDNVVIAAPVWPNIFQAARIAGAEARLVRLDADWTGPRWTLDLEKLFAACDGATRAIFIASPGNPTGWTMTRDDQKRVLDFARARGIAIIADEVYGTLVYDGTAHAPSFLEIAAGDDLLFVVGSFSKPWAMTGWRIGWLVHPAALENPVAAMAMANNTGATSFIQYGALAALGPEGDAFRSELLARCRKGRDVVEEFVRGENRLRWMRPDGAFYGFIEIEGLTDSMAFAQHLVRRAKVGVAPGSAFGDPGDARNESFIRICFAQDATRLGEGLGRIAGGLGTL